MSLMNTGEKLYHIGGRRVSEAEFYAYDPEKFTAINRACGAIIDLAHKIRDEASVGISPANSPCLPLLNETVEALKKAAARKQEATK
jgi:hypothetical protein